MARAPTARRSPPAPALTNQAIAQQLAALAQLLSTQGENPFKIRAYRRAAETIRSLGESVADLVRKDADLTTYSGIGKGIAAAVREIVLQGSLSTAESLRAQVPPEIAALSAYPRLDPKRVLRIYRALSISTPEALREKLEQGEIGRALGPRVEQHVRQAMFSTDALLLYDVDDLAATVRTYLLERAGVRRAEPVGEYRRRVEIVHDLAFLVETADFEAVAGAVAHYGGRSEVLHRGSAHVVVRLAAGITLTVHTASAAHWGLAQIQTTGSDQHLEQLEALGLARLAQTRTRFASEATVYRALKLDVIAPELREGRNEVALAAEHALPRLVESGDIRGELHAHSTGSDGAHSLAEMAAAARQRGYSFLGISDHSQSLKIAGGMSVKDLRAQLEAIDALNADFTGFRLLKSAEVDILADGSLDYPDELLAELDYTICSIHSRFAMNKAQQTERILRAMDNPHFNILGHATGRLLLRRPGYEIDIERLVQHARQAGCFFEINSSPDRLDLSSEHARLARDAGLKVAICTDAHSTSELDFLPCGIDQARRAGLAKADVLNARPWPELRRLLKR
jgi:DNA polymerase (family 10)